MIQVVTYDEGIKEQLREAFRACPDDFEVMEQAIEDGFVSIYLIHGDDYRLAVEGKGAVSASRELATYVKNSGLDAITTKTYFPLVARLLKRLGNVSTTVQGDHQLLRWEV
ncbi:TPA: DNAase [Vibrio parahaemolyticus]|uniref:DNAase n=1 Tax=Vibrio parahaemolyticus TaxID=670 RepID=UPI001122B6CB|nr:DNAase [Vibrio parahaemolyticus]TOL88883.1 DNAase [Vibrio parahaemolyticus]HCG9714480.1 DNAase [Vibrio parahaemolyticus]HCH1153052.1 DNAase [Vibrio parahaemolyticus]HCM1332984.1 DNAase [Vibrio parahaemolyticus]